MTKSGHTLAAAVDSAVGEANPNLVPEVHSIHGNVAEALVIKNGNLFFLSEPDGTVPLAPGHGFGLYYHDCRFLNGYELKICGRKPRSTFLRSPTECCGTLPPIRSNLHREVLNKCVCP